MRPALLRPFRNPQYLVLMSSMSFPPLGLALLGTTRPTNSHAPGYPHEPSSDDHSKAAAAAASFRRLTPSSSSSAFLPVPPTTPHTVLLFSTTGPCPIPITTLLLRNSPPHSHPTATGRASLASTSFVGRTHPTARHLSHSVVEARLATPSYSFPQHPPTPRSAGTSAAAAAAAAAAVSVGLTDFGSGNKVGNANNGGGGGGGGRGRGRDGDGSRNRRRDRDGENSGGENNNSNNNNEGGNSRGRLPNFATPFSTAWAAYNRALIHSPLRTKALTAGILNLAGDAMAQLLAPHGGPLLDVARLARFAVFGTCIAGPLGHFWFGILERCVSVTGARGVALKIFLDQVCWSPMTLAIFFTLMPLMEGRDLQASLISLEANFVGALISGWKVWPIVNCFTFGVVPVTQRILFVNTFALFWITFLSFISHQSGGLPVVSTEAAEEVVSQVVSRS